MTSPSDERKPRPEGRGAVTAELGLDTYRQTFTDRAVAEELLRLAVAEAMSLGLDHAAVTEAVFNAINSERGGTPLFTAFARVRH